MVNDPYKFSIRINLLAWLSYFQQHEVRRVCAGVGEEFLEHEFALSEMDVFLYGYICKASQRSRNAFSTLDLAFGRGTGAPKRIRIGSTR